MLVTARSENRRLATPGLSGTRPLMAPAFSTWALLTRCTLANRPAVKSPAAIPEMPLATRAFL
jgi:hypothetical protein